MVISAIGGTAGVGKTTLALHWAHRVAHRFTDGQLYVNLRGFDPAGTPAPPAEAIRGFLGALGVPSDRIPPTPDAQAGLYRSLLADKRILILLDNARDEQQVRPLLPASVASLVIVTSRNQLAGLAAADSARLLTLTLDGYQQAMTWFETEHDVLSAATAHAAGSGLDSHAWQLSSVVSTYLDRCGQWSERAVILGTGLAAATRLGDTAGQAKSCRLLANAHAWAGDYDQAEDCARRSAELYQGLGDRVGEAKTRTVLAVLAERKGRYADAIGHSKQALRLFQAAGHRAGVAAELNNIGWEYALLGDYQQARTFCRQSLTLSAEVGHRQTEGNAWDSLGYAEHHLGNFGEAAACYERALGIPREVGDRWSEADALTRLGDTRHAAGELPRARQAWQHALAIFDELEHPDAAKIRAKLAGLPPSVAE